MGTGLSQNELSLIRSVFKRHKEVRRVVLYGSRAKGTARGNSDIDLAIYGVTSPLHIESLRLDLEDLPLPYHFDLQSGESISHLPLAEHIRRVGVEIYAK